MLPAILIDTETTGKSDSAQVIEMAYLSMNETPGKIHTGSFVSYYKPTVPIEFGAMATHHIIPEDLEKSRPHIEALGDVPQACYWIGHNVAFDWGVLGSPDGVKLIDTLPMSRFLFPDLDSHTQSALIYYLGSLLGNVARARERLQKAHSAKADVENCNTILSLIVNTARQQGHNVSTWDAVYEFCEMTRIPSKMAFGKFAGQPIAYVDQGWRDWYKKQENKCPYILEAFEKTPYNGLVM